MPEPEQIRLDFQRVADEAGVSMRVARNQTIQEAARAVVRNTPVRTGRLRASWFWSTTFPAAAAATGLITSAKTTSPAVFRSVVGESARDVDGTLYFLNSAKYAKYVEARTQFVRRALGRGGTIANSAIRRIGLIRSRFK